MEKCELYKTGKAFDNEYHGDINTVLCEIEPGECQYNNEGERVQCKDEKIRTICKSNGLVKILGKDPFNILGL